VFGTVHHLHATQSFLDEVKGRLSASEFPGYEFEFVVGPVEETLVRTPRTAPIRLLRLDTDTYETTKLELERLFPLVVPGGVVIIDDYGFFEGARRATDDYFAGKAPMLWHRDDLSGRMATKSSGF